MKVKLSGKIFYETNLVKYLEIQFDRSLTWKQQVNGVAINLNKANAMLSKLRHLLDKKNSEDSLLCNILNPMHAILYLSDQKELHLLQEKSSQDNIFSESKFSHKFFL